MIVRVNELYRVQFLDPAGRKKAQVLKKQRARQAMVTIGMDSYERFFVLDAWAGSVKTPELIHRLFSMAKLWRPARVGIEANAMQELFADTVEYISKLKQQRVPIIPWFQPTKIEKDFRIRTTLQPVVDNGRLFLRENDIELEAELRSFPTGQFKDLVDALASAIEMCPAVAAGWQEEEEERLQEELSHDFYGYSAGDMDDDAEFDWDSWTPDSYPGAFQ